MSFDPSLKILMFGWEFSPLIAGGLGVVCRSIAGSIVDNSNTKITYVLPRIPDAAGLKINHMDFLNADVDDTSGIKVITLPSNLANPYYNGYQGGSPATVIQSMDSYNTGNKTGKSKDIYGINLANEVNIFAAKAENIAKHEDFDVIHNHDWMTASAAINAKRVSGKPMVMHTHATEVERTLGNPNPFIFEQELKGFEAADKIIAVSELTKRKIVENYGIEPEKIVVVHNAVDKIESAFGSIAKGIHQTDKVVLFLARLTAMKGANYLLAAAPKVLKVIPQTKFLFVGGGELLGTLVEKSVELGISQKVTFTGFLQHDQVDRAYRYADVFVMPSVTEPFGITPLEAIKNGTPVIISKQSGVSEVLQNVLKVDFWDVDELANKLIAVLKYGVLAEELTNNSKRDLESLNWDTQSEKILEVYKQVQQSISRKTKFS